jgi:hypothetical protein
MKSARIITKNVSDQIYHCLREIYPYDRRIIGSHPVMVIETDGMYVIRLCDDQGYMLDIPISTRLLMAQRMTSDADLDVFFGLMQKVLCSPHKH